MSDGVEIFDGISAPESEIVDVLDGVDCCLSCNRYHQTIHRTDGVDRNDPTPACGGGVPGQTANDETLYKPCAGSRRIIFDTPTLCSECFDELITEYERDVDADDPELVADGGRSRLNRDSES